MSDPIDTPDDYTARLQRRVAELELDNSALRKQVPAIPEARIVRPPEPPYFLRSSLKDSRFWNENRRAILDAASHGRLIDDTPGWRAGSPESEAARKVALNRYNAQQAAKAKEGSK
jgi:hypothetical protein